MKLDLDIKSDDIDVTRIDALLFGSQQKDSVSLMVSGDLELILSLEQAEAIGRVLLKTLREAGVCS